MRFGGALDVHRPVTTARVMRPVPMKPTVASVCAISLARACFRLGGCAAWTPLAKGSLMTDVAGSTCCRGCTDELDNRTKDCLVGARVREAEGARRTEWQRRVAGSADRTPRRAADVHWAATLAIMLSEK